MSNAIEFLSANYRPDLDVWVCRWINLLNPNHFTACYEYIFNQAIKHNWHYWLIDIRGRGKADKGQEDWYFNVFLPEKLKLLTGNNYLAYLVMPSHFTHIKKMKQFHKFDDNNKTSSLSTHFFQAEQDAFEWLINCRSGEKSTFK
ncbi:MAG: hypothetical protein COW65_11290 [Cytophagales bacterium CG18_big_fil_WC_8_21_14_2_50_42_9]|nr:MAG: hypothetical protein COW65_11290 [Cytophagales bacterium CG18_big_fil_WC_8_21_14_2_50_42_9]